MKHIDLARREHMLLTCVRKSKDLRGIYIKKEKVSNRVIRWIFIVDQVIIVGLEQARLKWAPTSI
jgi:hypothetical protein